MKYIFVLTAAAILTTAAISQTRYDLRMQVDSVQREFILSVPSGTPPAGGYPIVFVFHGTSQDGEKFYNDSQWKEKGEAEKILTVFPTALKYCVIEDGNQHITTKWHTGAVEDMVCPGQYLKDDFHFVNAMIDSLKGRFPVNARRMYATGFSNGASFTSKLAVQMSQTFAAVAMCGGLLDDKDSTQPVRNMPAWFVLGTRDDKWLQNVTAFTEFPFNDTTLMYLSRTINRFLTCENLTPQFTKTEQGRYLNYLFKTPASPEPSYEFHFTLVDDMYHVYPDGSAGLIVAANIFWPFFNQYQLPVKVERTDPVPDRISVYPNPASEYIAVDGIGEMDIAMYSTLGQKVFDAHAEAGTRIQLPKLTHGLYFARIRSGNQSFFRSISIQSSSTIMQR